MRTLIRFTLVLIAVTAISNVFAGIDAGSPFYNFNNRFNSHIVSVDSLIRTAYASRSVNPFFDAPQPTVASGNEAGWFAKGTHFCSCQILHLTSSNYEHQAMAVFAEKTNRGEGTEFADAKNRIEKEKKKLKEQFYDKLSVVAEMTAPVSCQSLYRQLKSNDQSLQVFEMLDADIK